MNIRILLALSLLVLIGYNSSFSCTSAIISGHLTKDGRPLLWKHRDTGEENNKVKRIIPNNGDFEYIALFNASDKDNKEAWMGLNSEGFAIMNTASYNLKDDKIQGMDKEGILMSTALRKCKTLNDFETFLKSSKKPLRVEANFGVIDALGNAAYFEVNNYHYTRFNVTDSPQGFLVRTNYSYSGRDDEGYGYIRENNALHLLNPHVLSRDITPCTFTEDISRTFYHSLIDKDYTYTNDEWIIDQDFIPRYTSTATCVIQGVLPNENPQLTTMWIGIGYPPCSKLRAAWTGDNGVPSELQGLEADGHSKLCNEAVAMKKDVFSIKRGNGKKYIAIHKLYNKDGTGYCQKLKSENLEYYKKANDILNKRRLIK